MIHVMMHLIIHVMMHLMIHVTPVWFFGSEFNQRLPLMCRKRRHIKGYKLPYFHVLIACMVFLHAVRRMNLDRWALGCPGSGNILFQRRMSSIF